MRLDLHIHSNASDGQLDPSAVVREALGAGLDVMALTDHDTVAGIERAQEAARGTPIEIIPAIEVSCTWEAGEIHILGYFVDLWDPVLTRHGERAGRRREERLGAMVDLLREEGVDISLDAVLRLAGDEVSSLGRPHLARALVEGGHVASVPEAFDRFIGNEHAAYLPTRLLTPAEGIEMIHAAGGVAVWAHPPIWQVEATLPPLLEAGLDGLEVFRPRVGGERALLLGRKAEESGLFVTGGSDWHGPDDGRLGDFYVTSREVARFLDAGGM